MTTAIIHELPSREEAHRAALTLLVPNADRAAANAAVAAVEGQNREPGQHFVFPTASEEFFDWKWPEWHRYEIVSRDHASYLAWRANSRYVAAVRGIRTAMRRDQKDPIPGFSGAALTNMLKEGNDCLVIPLYSLKHGPVEPVIYQVRPDQPRTITEHEKDSAGADLLDKNGEKVAVLGRDKKPKLRTIKFEAPSGAVRGSDMGQLPADVHPIGQRMLQDNPGAVLAWTEGAAKADAILSNALREGLMLVPVALTGVTMGYRSGNVEGGFSPTPQLVDETVGEIDHFNRLELLFWDSDWRTNRMVGAALVTFGKLLEDQGAIVLVVDTPGTTRDGKGGIDDFLTTQLVAGLSNPLGKLLSSHLISLKDAKLITHIYSDDDVGRSERLVDELLSKRSHTFDPTTTSWNGYDKRKGIWTDEIDGPNVTQIAKELTERDAADPGRYRSSRSANAIKNSASLASHDPRIQLRSDKCDLDPYLLNTPTGIVDLNTGELLPHSPAFAMRKVTRVGYDPSASSPVWDKFVLQSAGGDTDYKNFLQRFYGMALIGKVVEEVMGFITGGGRNGKSTFALAMQHALGTYTDTFPAKGFTGDLTDEMLIGLRGVRLVVAAETGAGNALDEQALKTVTSADMVSGRALYASRVTFAPSATMTLLTNHRPSVRANDEGTWRRMRIMPFDHQVTDAQKDPDLKTKLEAEAPGILRWLVEGCLEFGRDGLGTCAVVTEASEVYRTSQDYLGGFITEVLITGDQARNMHVGRAELKRLFDAYSIEQGRHTHWTLASFREGLQERGHLPRDESEYQRVINGYPHWRGIGVKAKNGLVQSEREAY